MIGSQAEKGTHFLLGVVESRWELKSGLAKVHSVVALMSIGKAGVGALTRWGRGRMVGALPDG